MGYYIDLEKITLEEYQKKLEKAYLPPSRQILKENLDIRFSEFQNLEINNILELREFLKKKDKISDLSKKNCFSTDYLNVLLREIKSLLPKPKKLCNFTSISEKTIDKLVENGIKNTEKLYDKILTAIDRKKLCNSMKIDENEILKLTKLTDLSRIKWVGITYAQILYDLGVDTVEKVTKSDSHDLHSKINQLIKKKNIYKGQIGLNDVNILIETAKELTLDIEY